MYFLITLWREIPVSRKELPECYRSCIHSVRYNSSITCQYLLSTDVPGSFILHNDTVIDSYVNFNVKHTGTGYTLEECIEQLFDREEMLAEYYLATTICKVYDYPTVFLPFTANVTAANDVVTIVGAEKGGEFNASFENAEP